MTKNSYSLKHCNQFDCTFIQNDSKDKIGFFLESKNGQICYEPNEFREKVLSVINDIKKSKGFKTDFLIIRKKIDEMLINLYKKFEDVKKLIDEEEAKIHKIKKNLQKGHKNVFDFDKESLHLMCEMIDPSYLDTYKKKQQKLRNTVEKTIQEIALTINNCCDRVNSISSVVLIENKQNNSILQGSCILGIKNGNYFYVNKDDSQEYAGEYKFEQKQGLWRDKINNQQFEFFVYEKGKIINQVQEYGRKNTNGNKEGKYLEKFGYHNQLRRLGYFKDGIEYGSHEIYFNGNKCGGGSYDQYGKKQDYWVEPEQNYDTKIQIISKGFYKDGLKFGKWATFENDFMICQGEYDINGMKSGIWIEFDKESNQLWEGNYQNGLRFQRWNIYQLRQIKNSKIDKTNADLFGGGCYNEHGEKCGEWIEQANQFNYYQRGYYNEEKIFGFYIIYKQIPQFTWEVNLYNELQLFLQTKKENPISQRGVYTHTIVNKNPFYTPITVEIFGGYYDNNQFKQGYWIEQFIFKKKEIMNEGYYLNNQRVGLQKSQKILSQSFIEKYYQQYGLGNYDQKGLKQGQWIEFDDSYTITLQGQFINGKRIGYWGNGQIQFCKLGGNYDDQGLKTNKWTEISSSKYGYHFIKIQEGQYLKGKKIGEWSVWEKKDEELFSNNFKQYKYGKYNQNGEKDGIWIKKRNNLVGQHLECEYLAGKKQRNWCCWG